MEVEEEEEEEEEVCLKRKRADLEEFGTQPTVPHFVQRGGTLKRQWWPDVKSSIVVLSNCEKLVKNRSKISIYQD